MLPLVFQFVQTFYWLALATWFGIVLSIALAAPVILRTVENEKPILTSVLSVNLEGQHGTLLAGTIVASLIQRALFIELICAGVLLLMLIAQPFVIDLSRDPNNPLSSNTAAAVVRSVLFLGSVLILLYDWRVLWPRIAASRGQYIDHADEPEIANPALDELNQHQRLSLNLLMITAALLLGMILFSSSISPPGSTSVQLTKSAK
jgi:hypothetical protein